VRLSAGARLGPYQLLASLGAGGMGEVYKARDTRLDRTVAVKILPEEFAADPDRRVRFEREARAAAALNHPHICDLYDVGEASDPTSPTSSAAIRFLVMEYLDGQTLAERLVRGPLPPSDVLRCAIELADALDHAHRHGLVHRDLKPGNVMMTKSGTKLLDFGLSKLQTTPDLLVLTTLSPGGAPLTAEGAVLGTFPYMAPEQLNGREADARTDIFAFGAMVYEMTTGRRAFEGSTAATVIGAVLHTDAPPVSSLQPLAPPALDRIVARCLAKDPDDRWQSARDLALELKWITEHPSAPVADLMRPQKRKFGLIASAALLISMLAVAAAVVYMRPVSVEISSVRLTFSPAAGVSLADLATAGPVTISPDGRRLAFVASGSDNKGLLWVRELDSTDAKPLPGSDGAAYPFWSPDSRLIGFFARGELKKISVAGGPPQTICPATQPRGGTWNQDGVIVFAGEGGRQLFRTSEAGGSAVSLPARDPNNEKLWPSFLPDGRHLVYFARPEKPGIYLGSLDSSATSFIAPGYSGATSTPGYLLLLQSGSTGASQTVSLIARPFDTDRLQFTGEGFSIADQVEYRTLWARGGFSVSNNGTLVTARDTLSTEMAWFDRRGQRLETVRGIVTPSSSRRWPELSPDDAMLATSDSDPVVQTTDIHLFDLTRGMDSRLTSNPALDSQSRWSPNGKHIVFNSARDGLPPNLFRTPAAGTGREERLLTSRQVQHATDWSGDGRFIVFATLNPKTQWDLWLLPMNAESAAATASATPLMQSAFNEYNGQRSPDGRWIAYQSDESGDWEIYLRKIDAHSLGVSRQISSGGAVWPVWRRDGQELFYIAADGTLTTVAMKTGRELEASAPQRLFKTNVAELWSPSRNYTVARDGQRFLINTRVDEESSPPVTVTLNWPASVRR
jgi:eukaryotic-like serine/threonine-protein kinase